MPPKNTDDEALRRFDEVRARIRERTAGFSEEEIATDVAAARAELPAMIQPSQLLGLLKQSLKPES